MISFMAFVWLIIIYFITTGFMLAAWSKSEKSLNSDIRKLQEDLEQAQQRAVKYKMKWHNLGGME